MASFREVAIKLSRAMARAPLAPDVRQMLTLEVAWALSYLLAEWRGGRDLSKAGLPAVALAFGFFRAPLERFIDKATAAEDAAALAGASSYFVSAVNEIGAERLKDAVQNLVFKQAQSAIVSREPPPSDLVSEFNPAASRSAPAAPPPSSAAVTPSRVRQFETADYPTQNGSQEIAFYKRQLFRSDLLPEQRWFAEEQLRQRGVIDPYPSESDARAVWQSVLAGPLHPELRRYYAVNLGKLGERAKS